MGFHYYNYSLWLEKNSEISPEKVEEILKAQFALQKSNIQIFREQNRVTVQIDGYKIWLSYMQDAIVMAEAKEFAEMKPQRTGLQNCIARIDMYAEDDPDEKYYNQHLFVLEAFSSKQGVHIYDPYSGGWFN